MDGRSRPLKWSVIWFTQDFLTGELGGGGAAWPLHQLFG